jgi:hypothetical protein
MLALMLPALKWYQKNTSQEKTCHKQTQLISIRSVDEKKFCEQFYQVIMIFAMIEAAGNADYKALQVSISSIFYTCNLRL